MTLTIDWLSGLGPSDDIVAKTNGRRRVLITGAAGRIGIALAAHACHLYDLTLMVRRGENKDIRLSEPARVFAGELEDLDSLKRAFTGIDTIVHLAATPDPSATWKEILADNIVGLYNTFTAAKAAGCRRVVYASSIHAVSGYPADVQVKTSEPVNPGDLYGVSKCFGEALGRYMAEQEGLSVIAIRIGAFQPDRSISDKGGLSMLTEWVSERDLVQLIERCVDDSAIRFAIFHGLSDNKFKRLDISDAREKLGYAPMDDSTRTNPEVAAVPIQTPPDNLSGGERSGLRDDL